jgi:hypothetical protein
MRRYGDAFRFAIILIAMATGSIRAEVAVSPLDDTKSPNGKYALALGGVNLGAHSGSEPGSASNGPNTGIFLVKLKPLRVIREIKTSIRDFRPHPENDYACYWRSDSSMVGIVYLLRSGSSLTVIQERTGKWLDVPLPYFNLRKYCGTIAVRSNIETPHVTHAAIESVSLTSHKISVRIFAIISGDNKDLDVIVRYAYLKRRGKWELGPVASRIGSN